MKYSAHQGTVLRHDGWSQTLLCSLSISFQYCDLLLPPSVAVNMVLGLKESLEIYMQSSDNGMNSTPVSQESYFPLLGTLSKHTQNMPNM